MSGGPMKEYDVVINGYPTTLRLSEDQARARGLLADDDATEAGTPKKRTASNKARQAPNKSA
jgi:hypothetical protein